MSWAATGRAIFSLTICICCGTREWLNLPASWPARLPENVHLILASRNDFLPGAAILRLGSRVCRIGVAQLRLTETELAAYARRCGAVLTNEEMVRLLHVSEGWFSAVYLHLRRWRSTARCLWGRGI